MRVEIVTIAVDRSRIWAVDGPAAGIDAGGDDDAMRLQINVTGLRLVARHSDLRSKGNDSATVLGVTGVTPSHRGLEVILRFSEHACEAL